MINTINLEHHDLRAMYADIEDCTGLIRAWRDATRDVRDQNDFIQAVDAAFSQHIGDTTGARTYYKYAVTFKTTAGDTRREQVTARTRREAIAMVASRMGNGDGILAYLLESARTQVISWDEKEKFTLTYNLIIEISKAVVPRVVSQYYPSNHNVYARIGWDDKDMEQHLFETVVLKKFVPNLKRNASYYGSTASFRKALYISCKNACMGHYRKHVKSRCRGDILRAPVIELNAAPPSMDQDNGGTDIAEADGAVNLRDILMPIVSQAPNIMVQRILLCSIYGHYDGKDPKVGVRNKLQIGRKDFDILWTEAVSFMMKHKSDIYDAMRQHRPGNALTVAAV
jgi:hypothetical protein